MGIKVDQSKEWVVFCQRKYVLDILKETYMIDYKSLDCPIDPNKKLKAKQGKTFFDHERYRRLVGKLVHHTITKPNLSFTVGVESVHVESLYGSLKCWHPYS